MFKTNNSNTRKRVYGYLIMAAFDYAAGNSVLLSRRMELAQ